MFKKLKLPVLAALLTLCCCLGACTDKAGFVNYSIDVIGGVYDNILCVAGENFVAEKGGYTRLYNKNGRAISKKYVTMEYDDSYLKDDYFIASDESYKTTLVNAKTGKELMKPVFIMGGQGEYFFSPLSNKEIRAIYKKDGKTVKLDGKDFVFDNVDAVAGNSLIVSKKDGDTAKNYLLSGGRLTEGVVSAISVYYGKEAEIVIAVKNETPDLYSDGVGLTQAKYAFTDYGTFKYGGDTYIYLSITEGEAAASERYKLLTMKAGGTELKTVWSGAIPEAFTYHHNFVKAGTSLINLINGNDVTGTAGSVNTISKDLYKNNAIGAVKTVKAVQYLDNSDNKYYIVDLDGNRLTGSGSSLWYYLDGKFVAPDKNYGWAGATISGTDYSSVTQEGRSLLAAQRADNGLLYDIYEAGESLTKVFEESVDWYGLYQNYYDNFEYCVVRYKNQNGEYRYRIWAEGRVSQEYLGWKYVPENKAGDAGRVIPVKVGEKTVTEKGAESDTVYDQYKLLNLNNMELMSTVFDDFDYLYTAAEGKKNKAAACAVASVTNLDADSKYESDDYIIFFLNSGKEVVIKGGADKITGVEMFTGVTISASTLDAKKQKISVDTYNMSGKKVHTSKTFFPMELTAKRYIESDKKSYTVFEGYNGKYGICDQNLKVVVKPLYDYIMFTPYGTAVVERYGEQYDFVGLVNMKGKELVTSSHRYDDNADYTRDMIYVQTSDPDCMKVYKTDGKVLLKKAYDFTEIEWPDVIKLNADKEAEADRDYSQVGRENGREAAEFWKVFTGKGYRLVRVITDWSPI